MITVAFTRQAIEDVRRARAAIIEGHPDGPAAGARLADSVAARIARAIDEFGQFPRVGRPGPVPGMREIVVPGPTHRLTFTIGYPQEAERVTILGITWGGRRFGADGRPA